MSLVAIKITNDNDPISDIYDNIRYHYYQRTREEGKIPKRIYVSESFGIDRHTTLPIKSNLSYGGYLFIPIVFVGDIKDPEKKKLVEERVKNLLSNRVLFEYEISKEV